MDQTSFVTTEEDNRLYRIANGDYGDDDDNENETAPPTAKDKGEVSLPISRELVYRDGEQHDKRFPLPA